MKIELPASFEQIVREMVDTGAYPDVEAVVSDALTQLHEKSAADRTRDARLIEELNKGLRDFDRGDFVEFESEEELKAFFDSL